MHSHNQVLLGCSICIPLWITVGSGHVSCTADAWELRGIHQRAQAVVMSLKLFASDTSSPHELKHAFAMQAWGCDGEHRCSSKRDRHPQCHSCHPSRLCSQRSRFPSQGGPPSFAQLSHISMQDAMPCWCRMLFELVQHAILPHVATNIHVWLRQNNERQAQ